MLEFETVKFFFGYFPSFVILSAAITAIVAGVPDTFRLTKEHIRETIERQERRNDK